MTFVAVWLMEASLESGASVEESRNSVLFLVVLFQNAYLIGIRNPDRPFWQWGDRENPWLFAGLAAALSIHVAAMHFPPTQALLGLSPVTAAVLVQCLAGTFGVLLVTEAAKHWVSRRSLRYSDRSVIC